VHNSPKAVLENLLSVRLLVCTNLFISNCFWTTCTKFDNCCQRYIASCGKFFIQEHIYNLGPKLLQWNFLPISELSTRSGAHKLFRRILDFAIFDRNFAKVVVPPSDENENYVTHLKEQSILKRAHNLVEIGL